MITPTSSDLLDCVIGALAFGKQGSAPPPEDHWLHQVWEIGDAERMERDSALPAQQSQWVPVSARLPQLDIPVWLFDEERGLFMGMRISSTDGWLWAECTFYRFFGSQWESIEAHFDDFEPSHWMPLPSAPGDTAAPEQAEQQCAGTGYDCPDCIHAAEQDAVKVPRGLLECYLGSSQKTEFKAR